jgi:predicted transcriptional regulator
MTNDNRTSNEIVVQDNTLPEVMVISDPNLICILLHEQKRQILSAIFSEMKNIQEIKAKTGINPGTIKRHLDELMVHHLVVIRDTKKSDYNITMKYYQAAAKRFEIKYTLQ